MTLLLDQKQMVQTEDTQNGPVIRVAVSHARDYPTASVTLVGSGLHAVDGTDVARVAVRDAVARHRAAFDRLAGD